MEAVDEIIEAVYQHLSNHTPDGSVTICDSSQYIHMRPIKYSYDASTTNKIIEIVEGIAYCYNYTTELAHTTLELADPNFLRDVTKFWKLK